MRLEAPASAETAADRFEVRPVDASNLAAVLALELADAQRGLVAPAAKSVAEAAYEPASRVLALVDAGDVVGLLLLYDARQDDERPANQLYVWRLMVDHRHQRRGIGRRAMAWVVDEARRLGMAEVGLSHQPLEGHAGPFYEKLGFTYTGQVVGNERKMVLRLR